MGNFFRIACPFLYQLDTVAYFALIRGAHGNDTIARIRATTQVLLDVYGVDGELYIHPLKVWERYSETMFFPHLICDADAISLTSSADVATLFARVGRGVRGAEYGLRGVERGIWGGDGATEETVESKPLLIRLLIGNEERITQLAARFFSLGDLRIIAGRRIGTGAIGGKSVGMLIARKILETQAGQAMQEHWEPHDSYYLGADIFYTYIVQNGWWHLWMRQKTEAGYFAVAGELGEKMLAGHFPDHIREQIIQMLEHFGQSPIIVRSSSLREDNFGNAFAGKYESVFCANQGTPEERLEAFLKAVRTVYASTMGADALAYRRRRGLAGLDEQMAILVQRVSGNHYGELFFPHVAGVGNSANLYVWDRAMDPAAGMLRIVFGLGTRAVDRVAGDYARLVPLDCPAKGPPTSHGDEKKFSQHKADVLDLRENRLREILLDELAERDLKTDKDIFFSPDATGLARLRELGRGYGMEAGKMPYIVDFKKLLTGTDFAAFARTVLRTLAAAYDYPVDIEFSLNFDPGGDFRFNLLQCRPLQTKGLGRAMAAPNPARTDIFIQTQGDFMGGNVRLRLDYVIFIKPMAYVALTERDKYQVARLVGKINGQMAGKSAFLAGPGRFGTTTPSLGVPTSFGEICHMAAICELSCREAGFMPDLSFGSHFFQDIVESDIFYAAVHDGEAEVCFRPDEVLAGENLLGEFLEDTGKWAAIIHVARTAGLVLHADVGSQRLWVYWER